MGEKRVGVARKIDEKQGCTVMVSNEAKTSQILSAFIIFKGGGSVNVLRISGKNTSQVM